MAAGRGGAGIAAEVASRHDGAMGLPRQSVELVIGGVRLHAERLAASRAGEARIVVLLHDSLGSVGLWRDFPERLAEATGLGVLAYDRRGHGASDPFGPEARTPAYLHEQAEVLEGVLAAADVREAVLFGHSDGASIALLAAALHPARVRGVVAEATHVFVEERTLEGIREAERAIAEGDLLARLSRHHGDKAGPLAAAWIGTWLSPEFRGWNVEAELRRIRCPVLVFQGAEDEYGTDAQVHAVARGVAGPVRAVILPGLRHTPHREDPGAVLRLVADHLAGA
jgi:pimeloyl-ACP methyl ester carboxylesterase